MKGIFSGTIIFEKIMWKGKREVNFSMNNRLHICANILLLISKGKLDELNVICIFKFNSYGHNVL